MKITNETTITQPIIKILIKKFSIEVRSRVVVRTPISAVNLPVTHVPGKLTARRKPSCVFALGRQSGTLSCVNALEDRAEQRLVFSHESLSEPLCLSLPLKRPDWIVYS
ncbi:hypothetical protein BD560DRAFT_493002 [Blakeslea trispora]|nr:hypothetical protein BD560DRAFT_493002 [Blakeslea trispora]